MISYPNKMQVLVVMWVYLMEESKKKKKKKKKKLKKNQHSCKPRSKIYLS